MDSNTQKGYRYGYWVSAGFYTFIQRMAEFIFGFFGFYFLVRIFSKDDFGIWVLYITVIAVIDMTRNGFLQNGLIKYLVGTTREESVPIQSAAMALNIAITLVSILVLVLITPWLGHIWNIPDFGTLMMIFYGSLVFYIPLTQVSVVLQARMDFRRLFYIQFIRVGLFFAFVFFLWFTHRKVSLPVLAGAQALIVLFSAAFACYTARRYLFFSRKIQKVWIYKLFHFGKYVLGTNLMSVVSNSLDKFVLGALLSPAQVAVNNVAGRILNFIEVPVNTVATIVYPKSAQSMEQSPEKAKESVRNLYEQSVGITLGITIPFFIVMILLAKPVILLVAGPAYLDAVPFFRVIIGVALLRPFDRQSGITLDAIGKPKLNFLVVGLNLLLITALSFLLIKIFALMGAAYAIIISLTVSVIIKQWLLARLIGTRFWMPITYTRSAYIMVWNKAISIIRKK
jgi:O-antigen/teichoic acid export membrane protein